MAIFSLLILNIYEIRALKIQIYQVEIKDIIFKCTLCRKLHVVKMHRFGRGPNLSSRHFMVLNLYITPKCMSHKKCVHVRFTVFDFAPMSHTAIKSYRILCALTLAY